MKTCRTCSLALMLLISTLLLPGCGKIKEERDQAQAEAVAAQAQCKELQAQLTATKEQLATSQTQLAAVKEQLAAAQGQVVAAQAGSQTEIAELKKSVASLARERDEAVKSVEQSAMNSLNVILQAEQKDKEAKAQIEALNKRVEELMKKLTLPR